MVFCNNTFTYIKEVLANVTILILVDGFLQYHPDIHLNRGGDSHNPYFSRWFSAIRKKH